MTSSREVASGRLGNWGMTQPTVNFLADHMVLGVASSRKVFQCWAFAALINFKYACWDSLATALSCGSFEARAFREDVRKAFHSIVSNRDHHGFALTEWCRTGVSAFRSVTRALRCEPNQFFSECLVGRSGPGGTYASLSSSSRVGQSVLTEIGAWGGGAVGW